MPNLGGNTEDYRGYTITHEGHGFYNARDLRGAQIASGEGRRTMVEAIEDHIQKVYRFWMLNNDLSPLQLQAARKLSIRQAARIVEDGFVAERANPAGLTEFERVIDAGGMPQ